MSTFGWTQSHTMLEQEYPAWMKSMTWLFVPWLTFSAIAAYPAVLRWRKSIYTWEMARRFSIWCWICKCFDDLPTNHVSTNHNAASLSICLVWKFSAATSSKLHTQSPKILRLYLHHVVHTTFHIPSTSHHLTSFRLKKLPGYVADASILMENKFPTIWQPCISSAEGNMCSKRI